MALLFRRGPRGGTLPAAVSGNTRRPSVRWPLAVVATRASRQRGAQARGEGLCVGLAGGLSCEGPLKVSPCATGTSADGAAGPVSVQVVLVKGVQRWAGISALAMVVSACGAIGEQAAEPTQPPQARPEPPGWAPCISLWNEQMDFARENPRDVNFIYGLMRDRLYAPAPARVELAQADDGTQTCFVDVDTSQFADAISTSGSISFAQELPPKTSDPIALGDSPPVRNANAMIEPQTLYLRAEPSG